MWHRDMCISGAGRISLHMSLVSLVPSRPRRFRMCRHLWSLSGNIVLLTLSSTLRENSLRSKRFRLGSKQKKTVKGDLRVWLHEKLSETQKMKEGEGGEEGRKRLQTNPSILKTVPDWLG